MENYDKMLILKASAITDIIETKVISANTLQLTKDFLIKNYTIEADQLPYLFMNSFALLMENQGTDIKGVKLIHDVFGGFELEEAELIFKLYNNNSYRTTSTEEGTLIKQLLLKLSENTVLKYYQLRIILRKLMRENDAAAINKYIEIFKVTAEELNRITLRATWSV